MQSDLCRTYILNHGKKKNMIYIQKKFIYTTILTWKWLIFSIQSAILNICYTIMAQIFCQTRSRLLPQRKPRFPVSSPRGESCGVHELCSTSENSRVCAYACACMCV